MIDYAKEAPEGENHDPETRGDAPEMPGETNQQPTVLDWFKALLGGRLIPIPPLETQSPAPGPEPPPEKPAAPPARPRLAASPAESVPAPWSAGRLAAPRLDSLLETWRALLEQIGRLPALAAAHPIRLAFAGVALLLTLSLLAAIPRLAPAQSFLLPFLAWLLAIALLCLAVRPTGIAQNRRHTARSAGWLEILLVTLLVALALGLRLWKIGSIPFTLAGDEASQGLEALKVIGGELTNPFALGWLSVPTMGFFLNSLSLRLLGATITGLRLPWALVGAATVLVTYFLVRRLQGPRLAFVSAALLGGYHYHIHFSRLGSNQIADPLLAGVSLLLLDRALQRKRALDWAVLGAVAGTALYFYAGARFVPVLLAAVILFQLLTRGAPFLREHSLGVLFFLVVFLVAAAPMLQVAVRDPGTFNGRLNAVGILQSGWLEREVVILDQSAATILFDQFRRAALAFNFYPDRVVWYGLRTPLLDPFFGALFVLGLGFATLQSFLNRRHRRLFPMVAWWWGAMLLGGMMTESPPSSMRLITLAVPTCFFIALGAWQLILLGRRAFRKLPRHALLLIALSAFIALSLRTYFIDYSPARIYGGQRAEMATEAAPRLNELKVDHDFYFVGPDWMYWGFATIPYLVPQAIGQDVSQPLDAALESLTFAPGRSAAFIFIPERMQELQLLAAKYPDGELEFIHRATDDTVLGAIYRLSPALLGREGGGG